MRIDRKAIVVAGMLVMAGGLQGFTGRHDDDKPVNLKVLPKDISEHELHDIMRSYSRSLGVKCGYCHVSETIPGQEHPKFDFASDGKPQKNIARSMMLMVQAINEKYIGKITASDHQMEQITCVTCHMGRVTPVISTDSLNKK